MPKEIIDLIIPSNENISRLSESMEITELSFWISVENEIGQWNKLSPICLIALDIEEFINIICSQINSEKFIQIPKKINLKIKLEGLSDSVIPKWENKYLKAKYNKKPNTKEFAINNKPFSEASPKIFMK